MKIKIKYHDKDMDKIQKIMIGDWIDLRVAEDVAMEQGEYRLLSLGISMQLPEGYEAHVAPRSSTFKNFGIICANSFGIIDESYCGDNDVWMFPALATRDVLIEKNSRICQFRIQKKMGDLVFDTVDDLGTENRGGLGSSGKV